VHGDGQCPVPPRQSVASNYRALLFLPPYSPQLAPIERVWKLDRRLATHNRFFATVDDVLTAVSSFFDR
jgi:transposase